MKLNHSFFYTLRENVKDEDSKSSNLLVRAGMIKKSSAGGYMILPLGYKVLTHITAIIREEMNSIDCQELTMPALLPEEIFIASGRRDGFGKSMFSLKDRLGKSFVLGPTHEELFAVAASMKIQSYKDLPFSLYQIQTKYRDEPRPRYGLIRVREFLMKDAYTFDSDEVGLNIAYEKQFNAYKKIFDRLGLDYKIVRADTGVMGGLLSEEFQAVSDIGEDTLVLCDSCDFASNIEVAECVNTDFPTTLEAMKLELVKTPHARTIDEVVEFLNQPIHKFVKTLIYKVDDKIVACLVRGDREVNETKLRKLYHASEVELADAETVTKVTGASVGFAGPIRLDCDVVIDNEVNHMHNFITGANQTGYHYIGVNLSDFTANKTADIRNIQEGDICPICGGKIYFKQGIEVGNTFKLGTKYSTALGLEYSNSDNQLQPVWMGSYGIGPARCMAAIAEQYADDNGLVWPINIAPYKIAIVLISTKDEEQTKLANTLYTTLTGLGYDPLLDDRDERPGVKFKDMDLVGIPYRITIGKKASENIIEFKHRLSTELTEINVDDLLKNIHEYIK